MSEAITVEETLPHAPALVWRAVTTPELIARWVRMTPRGFVAVVGAHFTFRTDPAGAWDGTIRLVAYVQADLDSHEAIDPLLPEVAWSWLAEALDSHTEQMTALGGTVTATTSVRYGDISGPPRAHQLELRASWTATTPDVGSHVQAFCDVLEHAAGLPPAGITDLSSRSRA